MHSKTAFYIHSQAFDSVDYSHYNPMYSVYVESNKHIIFQICKIVKSDR